MGAMKKFLWFMGILFVIFLVISIFGKRSMSSEDYGLSEANIAVIEINGVIMESMPVIEQIYKLDKNSQIKGLVVRVDSPGGAVGASQEIYMAIKEVKKKMPVVVSMGNIAASGGLYVSIGADKIYALPGTLTGSVGVLLQSTNLHKVFEKLYLEPITIKSGSLKDAGNPTQPIRPEAQAYLKSVIMQTFDQFRTHVATERKLTPESILTLSDGRVVDGLQAVKLGLIDEVGTFNDAVSFIEEKANLESKPKFAWLSRKKPSLAEYFLQELISPVRSLLAEPFKGATLEYRLKL